MAAHRWPPRGERLTLGLADCGLPEIPVIGMRHVIAADEPLPDHGHDGVIEITCMVSGERHYVQEGRDYRLRGNDVLVTLPGEVHGSGRHPIGKGLQYWIRLRLPARRRPFLGLGAADARPLIRCLRQLPRRHFSGGRELHRLFERILAERDAPTPALRKLRVAAAVIDWLLAVIARSGGVAASAVSPGIARARDRIDGQQEGPCSLAELAVLSGLSLSYFKARFTAELGMPPGQYLQRRRLELAERLLRSGRWSVTEVAHRLDFASSQHFATVFRRYRRVTPSSLLPRS
jgi:AraC-like DNA-binding protein